MNVIIFLIYSAVGQDVATPTNPLTVTFGVASPVGLPSNSECVTYTILDDDKLEGDHDFVSQIITVPSDATIGAQSTTNITIADNDRKYHWSILCIPLSLSLWF